MHIADVLTRLAIPVFGDIKTFEHKHAIIYSSALTWPQRCLHSWRHKRSLQRQRTDGKQKSKMEKVFCH